jgi:hypothetical protein
MYPSISEKELLRVARLRIDGDYTTEPKIEWLGSGDRFDDKAATASSVELEERLKGWDKKKLKGDPDAFEGNIASTVYDLLKDTPLITLDDPGFWRYLAMEFWWYAEWRQKKTFQLGKDYIKYVDGRNSNECVILRTFLRGQIASTAGDPNLASVIPEATDFWRSHIVRVLNWKFPSVVKAFIKLQERERMAMGPGGELRIVGRRLNRRRANLILTEYSYQEATELLDELRS